MTYYQVKPEYDGKTLYKKCGDRVQAWKDGGCL